MNSQFFTDCDPRQAIERQARANQIAHLIDSSNSFGTLNDQEKIKTAFQAEANEAKNVVEALSRIGKLIGVVNNSLKIKAHLGPSDDSAISDTLYLVREHAPTQSLSLNLTLPDK